jgi:hypothetical protein
MKFMVAWTLSAANFKEALGRFMKTGGAMPEGLKMHGRWHAPGGKKGFLLVEGSEAALTEHIIEWADLLEADIYPVVDDAEAAAVLARVSGKR